MEMRSRQGLDVLKEEENRSLYLLAVACWCDICLAVEFGIQEVPEATRKLWRRSNPTQLADGLGTYHLQA